MAPTPPAPSPRIPRALSPARPHPSRPLRFPLKQRSFGAECRTTSQHDVTPSPPPHRAPHFLLLTCSLLARAMRPQPVTRIATPPSPRRSDTAPLSVVGPPRAAEPRAWLGPVARSEASTTGRDSTSHAGGSPKEDLKKGPPTGDATNHEIGHGHGQGETAVASPWPVHFAGSAAALGVRGQRTLRRRSKARPRRAACLSARSSIRPRSGPLALGWR